NGNYKFNDDEYFKNFFTNKSCDNDIDKVNAISFWLFKQNLWDSSSSSINAKSNTDIVYYIVIWLIYMLRLKDGDQTSNVIKFYNTCIQPSPEYINSIKDTNAYNIYKKLIDNKLYLMNKDIKDISKIYDALKSLCNMYNEFDGDDSGCTENLDYAKKFAEKYEILLNNNNNDTDTEDSLYSQILSILSTDYYNFIDQCYETKEGCGPFPALPDCSRCSLIKNALISITFIFVAIPIFLGFAYK
ncbi:Plasmodium variant antigen protein Cir/Yir/Bir, putative, partial [Plasmodium chabaudi adami]